MFPRGPDLENKIILFYISNYVSLNQRIVSPHFPLLILQERKQCLVRMAKIDEN